MTLRPQESVLTERLAALQRDYQPQSPYRRPNSPTPFSSPTQFYHPSSPPTPPTLSFNSPPTPTRAPNQINHPPSTPSHTSGNTTSSPPAPTNSPPTPTHSMRPPYPQPPPTPRHTPLSTPESVRRAQRLPLLIDHHSSHRHRTHNTCCDSRPHDCHNSSECRNFRALIPPPRYFQQHQQQNRDVPLHHHAHHHHHHHHHHTPHPSVNTAGEGEVENSNQVSRSIPNTPSRPRKQRRHQSASPIR